MDIKVNAPLSKEEASKLKAGDIVKITGTVYTARDAAHKRMLEQYDKTGKFPFDMRNAVIYYAGPAPAKPGQVIGPAGPTTSYRMDSFAPKLMDFGQTGMIGKGARNKEVIEAMKRNKAVYFAATGGAAALISSHIKKCEIIAYEDLGAEAVRKLYVEDFPAIVVIDTEGNNLYESEKEKYRTL
ncbi:MAG: Fe-S-containing hydro-lyase [Clostridia bacterium]|jgi:fumarate hydratase subunit beta|nr:Fe-S-containing hydro-lyase [Clostridia bacterium]MCI2001105.1 Fe-S-containing hydro-lyase [Clostridia bacterium]MCI2015769.1 Fe-S-containing hydro-lyase [Clostridia bacterium]